MILYNIEEEASKSTEQADDEDLDAYMTQLSKAPTEKSTSIYNLQKELKRLEKVTQKRERKRNRNYN